jgi:hypothetical protein
MSPHNATPPTQRFRTVLIPVCVALLLAILVALCAVFWIVIMGQRADAGISDWFRKKPNGPVVPYNQPEALQAKFVEFVPNNPLLYPDNLDLFHIEAKRRVLGAAIISPNRQWMASSEVTLLPQTLETTSRVFITPVGRPPVIQEYLTPEALARVDKYATIPTRRNSPQIGLLDIRPEGFYRQYQMDYQKAGERTLLKTDPQHSDEYDAHIYHVVDWSPAGDSLLVSYREGVFHSGVFKTIPVTVNTVTGESTAYRFLPQSVWHSYCSQPPGCSQDVREKTIYDIRVLGWQRGVSDEILLKLVRFESPGLNPPRGEQILGYYAYNLPQGQLVNLGPTLPADATTGHGWVVKFVDYSDYDDPKSHATQVIPKNPQYKKLKPAQPRNSWLY